MIMNRCTGCGETFLVKRAFCPECHSSKIEEFEVGEATVVISLKLVATPEPYPDEYFLVFAEHNGTGFFCRSEENLKAGSKIRITSDEDGLICHSL